MVLCTIVHFYTVSVSTFQTAFKKIDANLEFVSASLRVGRFVLHKRVTLPLMMTTISEVFVYFFISGMTTTSAIIMIYYPSTVTATIGIIGLNDNGAIAPAMAMGILIVAVNIFARILQALAGWYFEWNQRRVSSVERLGKPSSINGIGSTAVKLMRRSQ
jgi:iron(III) transport system permease protein